MVPEIYPSYLDALLAGDRKRCQGFVEDLLNAGVAPRVLYVQLFERALYELGALWERNRVSVATEHMATAITERLLAIVQGRAFSGPERHRTLLVACPADEYHQVGARIVADLAELSGWRSHFLGANTPQDALLRALDTLKPDMLGLSLSIYFNLPALLRALDALARTHPEIPVLVGGQAFRWGGTAALETTPRLTYCATLDEMEHRLEQPCTIGGRS